MYFYAEEGGTPIPGCTLSPLGEYYFPPKLLTAAAMLSYLKDHLFALPYPT